MSKRNQQTREYNRKAYHEGRALLIKQMGGKCTVCGATEKLQFHHLYTRTWIASKKNRWTRLAIYRREYNNRVLNLLCSDCNKRAGKPDENFTSEEW